MTRTTPYGAFVDLDTGHSGLVHISELSTTFVRDVDAHVARGDRVHVRVITVEPRGRIGLSVRSSRHHRATGYDRVVDLGGDWGHSWADPVVDADGNETSTTFMRLARRPVPRPHEWEPDPELFREWHEPEPPAFDDTHYNPIEGRPSV